jgi:di- and tripeptidase
LQVSIEHIADWWLGDVEDLWFKALENSIREEWDVEPLRIREGGVSGIAILTLRSPYLKSIPSIPYLEKEFGCHALQLPLGQSSVSR